MASSSTAGTLKVALIVAVCVVLLHSSMGQEPTPAPAPPPLPYCSNCASDCYKSCQARYDAETQKCNLMAAGAYDDCMKGCAKNKCNGNSYVAVRDSCNQTSCDARSCGPPCAVDCCNSCRNDIGAAYAQCMFWAGRTMNYCPFYCNSNCNSNCNNATAPTAPSPMS